MVKNPSANARGVRDASSIPGSGRSPGGEGMATHSSILAWKIPWTEEPGGKKKKRCFPLGRKAMTNLDGILKSRGITFPTKVRLVKAMVSTSSHVQM